MSGNSINLNNPSLLALLQTPTTGSASGLVTTPTVTGDSDFGIAGQTADSYGGDPSTSFGSLPSGAPLPIGGSFGSGGSSSTVGDALASLGQGGSQGGLVGLVMAALGQQQGQGGGVKGHHGHHGHHGGGGGSGDSTYDPTNPNGASALELLEELQGGGSTTGLGDSSTLGSGGDDLGLDSDLSLDSSDGLGTGTGGSSDLASLLSSGGQTLSTPQLPQFSLSQYQQF